MSLNRQTNNKDMEHLNCGILLRCLKQQKNMIFEANKWK